MAHGIRPRAAWRVQFSPGMKRLLLLAATIGLMACQNTASGGSEGGTGGTTSAGGTTASGGTTGSGGTTSSGGDGGAGGLVLPDVPCTDCLGTSVAWGASGGLSAWFDSYSLADCRVFTATRTPGYGQDPNQPDITCTGEVGGCDAAAPNVHDLEIALAHPDVIAAFAEPQTPLYGWDDTCTDGNILIVSVGEKSIHVGEDCATGYGCAPEPGQCKDAPPGVQHLLDVLDQIQLQQLQTPDCAGKF